MADYSSGGTAEGSYEDFVKIAFPVEDGPVGVEWMWARPVPQMDGLYTVDNIPFWVYGVSLGDTVRAATDEEGSLRFVAVEVSGGHRTVRVLFHEGADESWGALETLAGYGVRCERGFGNLYAVDVPPETRPGYAALRARLAALEAEGALSFEEAG